jgi:hypothetical protein
MPVIPEATPVTMPDDGSTVAVAVLVLVHVPPGMELESVVVKPIQVLGVPENADGSGLIVTSVVVKQPVPNV